MLSANPKDERRRQTSRNAERNAKKRKKLSAHEKDGRERQTKRNAERNATQKRETNREREREREKSKAQVFCAAKCTLSISSPRTA